MTRFRKLVHRGLPVAAASLMVGATLIGATPSAQQPASLRLSNAAVTLEYPEPWRDWAINLASYSDVAAARYAEILGVALPGGVIRWEPAASGPGSSADGIVEVGARGATTVVTIRTNVPLMLQDFGAAYALGYGRWLGAYVVARVALGAPGSSAPWWTEGAALYLTDRLFRDEQATTPILYGIEGNFVRAARSGRPIDLAASSLDAAGRGKAYATFKLLEGLYGGDVVASTIGTLIARPSVELAAIVDAIGRDRVPDPDAVLRDWLEPTVAIDVGLKNVSLRDDGASLRARVTRETTIPVAVIVAAPCTSGDAIRHEVPAGTDDVDIEMDLGCTPTSVVADPDGLVPDMNRSNNRHGFGSAENIRRFYEFDRRFSVGELELDGTVALDPTEQRAETFRLRLTNLMDRTSGVGVLVSAEWFDRPERIQRAFFVNLSAGESRVIEESLGYPNRGTGHARIDARFWEAASVEDLTDKLVARDPGAVNSYVVVRDAPKAPRRANRGIYRRPPQIAATAGEVVQAPEEDDGAPVSRYTAPPGTEEIPVEPAVAESSFGISLRSPLPDTVPIGDVQIEADVTGTGGEADVVEFWVNDRKIATINEAPYRVSWTFPEQERVFVIRAVAVAGDRVASDDVVLDRASVSFGSTVNLVTVHATVRDGQGKLIRDLTPEDFQVIEDGLRQEIVQFDFGEVPVSASVLLDQSSSMIGGGIRAERAGARRLVDSLVSDINRAMILGFNDRVYLYADFTTDKAALNAALDAIDPDGSTALYDTLAESVRKLNRRTGKRAIVVLSDGLDTHSEFAYEDVVEYLRQSDVLVYTIGLQLMHEGTEYGDASGAVKRGVEQLRILAEGTGGAAYFPLGFEELEEIYGLIADELNSQYALSYYPANQRYDGAWRRLRIELPGRPGAFVQVREGYYASDRAGG